MILDRARQGQWDVLATHAITRSAADALEAGDHDEFIRRREAELIAREQAFQRQVGVQPSPTATASALIDTE